MQTLAVLLQPIATWKLNKEKEMKASPILENVKIPEKQK